MTLKLTLARFGAPRTVARSLAVCASLALALALGCGGGGGETPILDKSESAVVMDVSAILGSSEIPARLNDLGFSLPSDSSLENPDEWKDELRDGLESDGFAPADSISARASVSASRTSADGETGVSSYTYTVGGLDFADLRNELEDDGLEAGSYRGFELWEDSSNTFAVLEDRDLVVEEEEEVDLADLVESDGSQASQATGNAEFVKEVIKAFDRGDGFADESDPLKRALDKAGDGLVVRARTNCSRASIFSNSSSSCKAVAESVTGGDADKTEMFVAYLFSSERRAESAMDDIEDSISAMSLDADLADLKADGEFVTFRATIYE